MSRSKKEICYKLWQDFLWCVLSFIVILLFIFLGYLLATIPSMKWVSFSEIRNWILSLKLLTVLQWCFTYLLIPIIMIVSAIIIYRQWQYDKFVEIYSRVLNAETLYIEQIDELTLKQKSEDPLNKAEYESQKLNIMISFLNELEILALGIKQKAISYKVAKDSFIYLIQAIYNPSKHKILAEYLSTKDKKYYAPIDELHDKYKKEDI